MSLPKCHHTEVLKFWRSVETFTLPDIPAQRKNDGKFYTDLERDRVLPWESGGFPVREGKKWIHTLYFHVVSKEAVVGLLARLSKSKEFRETVNGRTCLSALVLDDTGLPIDRTYSITAFAYGIKIFQDGSDPEELAALIRKAQEDFVRRFHMPGQREGTEDKEPELNRVDWRVLQKELEVLGALVPVGLQARPSVLCVSESVSSTVKPEAPFLNSYYMDDLNRLISLGQSLGRPLEIFLAKEIDRESRQILLRQEKMLEALDPRKQSPGRWPSNPCFGLYSGQQVALHLSIPALRDDSGLMGINGPPGTGKTTLLREIIADVVVTRAKRLLKANVEELFTGSRVPIVEMLGYYKINKSVFGNDGIVVSGNNNSAIENISRELPALKSVDREAFEEAAYFPRFASAIREEACWGMLSATLGKAENRNAFVNRFWFNRGNGFGKYLKGQYEDPVESRKNAEVYREKAGNLGQLLKEYDQFQGVAGEYHGLLCGVLSGGNDGDPQKRRLIELARRLEHDWEITRENLPGPDFLRRSLEEIHRMEPYSSAKINILRSRIFLASLELHEYAILVNARYFNSNLNAFINIVSNKHAGFIDEDVAGILWDSFFFCIPVVAVTLASFQRQFSKIGRAGIGWLLLDEAGQATPGSACGAIWRSGRCIVIGDTFQIPPIVTIPRGLVRLLQESYGIADDCWSPLGNSAQSLADRATNPGTYIGTVDERRIWTGIPLRAHRRCEEPMFSISNTIAYNGQMVKVTPAVPNDIPTGESGWIDVKGVTFSDRHTVVEELQVLEDLLGLLTYYEGRIYVISPFRSIADACRDEFRKKYPAEYGTIHTFQGKEAEIVFIVMGTSPDSYGARSWVSETPNILNVAVTRAKQRLYVIGNKEVWRVHPHFDHLAESLPAKAHYSGRLF